MPPHHAVMDNSIYPPLAKIHKICTTYSIWSYGKQLGLVSPVGAQEATAYADALNYMLATPGWHAPIGRAAAGKSKEHPEEKSAAFDCRSSVWCHMDGGRGREELKRSRWPEAPAGMVYRLPGNRLCRPTSCRQRGDSGSEWAVCRGSRRAQASWSAWKGLHRGHSQGSQARGLRRLPNHDRHRRVALSNWAAQARPINGQTTPTNNLKKPCYWVQENSHEGIRVRA